MYDENGEPIQEDPWSSIVDLMSALVLVLFLAIIFFITNYSEVSEALVVEKQNLEKKSADLAQTRDRLMSANQQNLDLMARERKLIAETERLNADRTQLISDKEKLTAETERLNADRLSLLGDKEKLTAETERLNADRAQLISDKAKLTAETERLNADRTSLLSDKAKLTAAADRLNAERVSLLNDKEKLTSETARLNSDRTSLLGDKSKLTAETERLNAERVRLQARAERLEEKQSELIQAQEALRRERSRLISDKANLSGEAERLNAQVIKLQAALREATERQQSLMSSLENTFKRTRAQGVSVDREGGKIILKSSVLFSKGKSELTEAGKKSLRHVSRGLIKVLTDPKLREIVEGVMIEGHTSSSGKYGRNLRLSAERSLNTLDYLLSLPTLRGGVENNEDLRKLFFAGAFGESRPVFTRGREDPTKSRRIEIRVLFNQSQVKSLTHDLSK